MAIRSDTGTIGAPTKVDVGDNLAGNQRVHGGIVGVEVHLPYSPAAGFPLQEQQFDEGDSWSEVEGYVHPGSGPNNLGW